MVDYVWTIVIVYFHCQDHTINTVKCALVKKCHQLLFSSELQQCAKWKVNENEFLLRIYRCLFPTSGWNVVSKTGRRKMGYTKGSTKLLKLKYISIHRCVNIIKNRVRQELRLGLLRGCQFSTSCNRIRNLLFCLIYFLCFQLRIIYYCSLVCIILQHCLLFITVPLISTSCIFIISCKNEEQDRSHEE